MAGKIQEPLSLSSQADSLHSGSISFGRFEAESLSWERRSSFSHNRYLEEVEKYSKPGSVTEKRQYFEAHFKKKALLSPSSLQHQNGAAYHISEKDAFENMGYGDDFENSSGTQYQDTEHDAYDSMSYANDFPHVDEVSHLTHFDKGPYGSEYDGGHELTESEREETLYSEIYVTHIHDSFAKGTVPGNVTEEKLESQIENSLLINTESEEEVKDSISGEVRNVDETCNDMTSSLNILATAAGVNIASTEHQEGPFLQVKTGLETKFTKPRLKSQASAAQMRRNTTSEASKEFSKTPGSRERDGSLSMKKETRLSHSNAPTTSAIRRKPEEPNGLKAKVILDNKSTRKDVKVKKAADYQSYLSDRDAGRTHQTTNRSMKQFVSSTNPTMKQSAAVFRFKSDERAEKRKEFNMKLEEKMHAKEAQMNQMQAKTLEKTEAEIKQFRRSLNFKATPMPSFYHEGQRGSGKSKVASSNIKTMKPRRPSTSPSAGATERSSSCLKEGNGEAFSATETAQTVDSSQDLGVNNIRSNLPSETSTTASTSASKSSHFPPTDLNNAGSVKKDQGEDMYLDVHRHRVAESCKVSRGQTTEGKHRVGSARNSNEMVRKNRKTAGMGSGSGTGHIAVGVAS